MNERRRLLVRGTTEVVHPPAFPLPGNNLFQRIGAAVSAARGYSLDNRDFARLIGKSTSTTSHWFGAFPQPHLVSFVCLLEQLPPHDRHRVVDSLCRDFPLCDHPRLRHNPVVITALKNLLAQNTGLSLLVDGSDEQRTFLLNALGHTCCRIDRQHRTAAGIDLHEPDWFVPIETVFYMKGPTDPVAVGGVIRRLWPEILSSKSPLILLNNIWSTVPEFRADILSLAARKHVILADQQISIPQSELEPEHRLHTLSVSSARENANWIAVQVKRLH